MSAENGTAPVVENQAKAEPGAHSSAPRTRVSNNGRSRVTTVHLSESSLRRNFAGLAGLQYDGDRDVYEVAGYPKDYTFAEGWDRYRRQDIARRVVDLPAKKTWRHQPEVMVGDEKESDWHTAWYGLWDRLKLRAMFERADRMAAIGEYSVVLLGLGDAQTDGALKEPAKGLSGPDGIAYAQVYHQDDATIQKYDLTPTSPRFGQPLLYQINLGGDEDGVAKASLQSIVVHWTRVLHIVEDPLTSGVKGMPALEHVLNRLIDLEKIAAGSAEAFWQLASQILLVNIDRNSGLSDAEFETLDERLEEMVHDLRRHILAEGLDAKFIGGDSPDPTGAADLYMMLISAARGIPKRILFGTETGERASQQDERAFLGMVSERQEQYAEPTMVRAFTDRMIELGVLPEPKAPYTIVWPSLFEETDAEKADADKSRADAAKALTPMGGNPLDVADITEEGRVRLKPTVDREG